MTRIFGKATASNLLNIVKKRLNEFEIDFNKDIIALQTDGCNVMRCLGKLAGIMQQLCYAHAAQLAIGDLFYAQKKKKDKEKLNSEDNANKSETDDQIFEESCDTSSDTDNDSYSEDLIKKPTKVGDELTLIFEKEEIELVIKDDYLPAVVSVRNIVKLFKKKNNREVLSSIVKDKFGREMHLNYDCDTRWSSVYQMLSAVIKLYDCIELAFIKLKQDKELSKKELKLFELIDLDIIKELNASLEIFNLLFSTLSHSNISLLQAELIKDFCILELGALNTPISNQLKDNLEFRFDQRKTICTSILQYLHGKDVRNLKHKEPEIKRSIVELAERLYGLESDNSLNNLTNSDTSDNVSREENLLDKFRNFEKKSAKKIVITDNDFVKMIKLELESFSISKNRGSYLELIYNCLLNIKASTVDVERIFSGSKFVITDLRSLLDDDLVDNIVFLKEYFKGKPIVD